MVPQPDPGEATTTLLRTAYNAMSAAIYRHVEQAAGAGLRPAHGNALEMLAVEDGLRLTDIAAQAGMTTQSMGELVDDLVTKGYLRRQEDPADRRAKRIYLTGKGRQAADAGHAATAPRSNNSRPPSGHSNTGNCAATWRPSPTSAFEPARFAARQDPGPFGVGSVRCDDAAAPGENRTTAPGRLRRR